MDAVITDVAYVDQHRPATIMLHLFAEQVRAFREVTQWVDDLKAEEHDPT